MGLKGYRLWVNLIQPAAPHRVQRQEEKAAPQMTAGAEEDHGGALQVESS
jgi:hypothetical protein